MFTCFFENSLNLHSNFVNQEGKTCNVWDEAVYCQQLIIDRSSTVAAVSVKCACPDGYRCPSNPDDTQARVQCFRDEDRDWNRCLMRCVPIGV
ncbi:unnamed protein product, partial [Mesorhabditis belari]